MVQFLTTYDPSQASLGGGSYVDRRIIAALGNSVDIHYVVDQLDRPPVTLEVSGDRRAQARTLAQMALRRQPYQEAKFTSSPGWPIAVQRLGRKLDDQPLITSQWPALLVSAALSRRPLLHIAHNVDAVLAQQYDPRLFRMMRNASNMWRKEQTLLQSPLDVVCLSTQDARRLTDAGIPCRHLAFSARSEAKTWQGGDFLTIGLIGKISWPPNQILLTELISQVLPALQRANDLPSVKLIVAGRGSESLTTADGSIVGMGRVADTRDFYEAVDVVITTRNVSSTGISIKCLEAIEHSVPLICPDSVAAEMSLEGSYYPANSNHEIVAAVRDYLSGRPASTSSSHPPDSVTLDELAQQVRGF